MKEIIITAPNVWCYELNNYTRVSVTSEIESVLLEEFGVAFCEEVEDFFVSNKFLAGNKDLFTVDGYKYTITKLPLNEVSYMYPAITVTVKRH